jgi:hypothetical protein
VTNAIGTVANNIDGNSWTTYVVAGEMKLTWDFNKHSGNFTISHFNRSVMPGGLTLFGGALSAASELPKKPLGSEWPCRDQQATGYVVRGPDNFDNRVRIAGHRAKRDWH